MTVTPLRTSECSTCPCMYVCVCMRGTRGEIAVSTLFVLGGVMLAISRSVENSKWSNVSLVYAWHLQQHWCDAE